MITYINFFVGWFKENFVIWELFLRKLGVERYKKIYYNYIVDLKNYQELVNFLHPEKNKNWKLL